MGGWVKVDDSIFENAKFEGLSDGAAIAYFRGMCASNRNLTDGYLSKFALKREGISRRVAQELCDRGLWEKCDGDDGGYLQHDYLAHQRSAEEIKAQSGRMAELGAKGGAAKRSVTPSKPPSKPEAARLAQRLAARSNNAQAELELEQEQEQENENPLAADAAKVDEPGSAVAVMSDHKPRKRNPAFDTLAASTGHDPTTVTKSMGTRIAAALAQIRDVCPDLSAEALGAEIERRAGVYRTKWPKWELTPTSLASHWSACAADEANVKAVVGRMTPFEKMHKRVELQEAGMSPDEIEGVLG